MQKSRKQIRHSSPVPASQRITGRKAFCRINPGKTDKQILTLVTGDKAEDEMRFPAPDPSEIRCRILQEVVSDITS